MHERARLGSMLPTFVLEQLSQPRGKLAPLTAALLNTVNARTIVAGVSALELQPGQRAADVGFGGGLSIPLLLRAVGPTGQLFAIETSEEMLARARRRFIVPRMRGRLRIERAVVESLPLGDDCFDAAMSLNTIMFWTDVAKGLRELARILMPGGRLVLGLPDPEHVRSVGLAAQGHRVVVPERLSERLHLYGFEPLELRQTPDGTTLLVATRINELSDDGL